MSLTDFFVFFSKIYIRLGMLKNDNWLYYSTYVLTFLITINIYVYTSLFYDTNIVWVIILYFTLYFILLFHFDKKFSLDDIRNYEIETNKKIALILFIFFDLVFLLYTMIKSKG